MAAGRVAGLTCEPVRNLAQGQDGVGRLLKHQALAAMGKPEWECERPATAFLYKTARGSEAGVSMRQGARELITALTAAVAIDELAARDVAAVADVVAQAGSPVAAKTLRALSGIHERRAKEARSQLALLTERYGGLLQGGGDTP